ncbi:MAG: aminotransferase class I/II-fold pyridoxal phosphate-dependent enzyme [Polyangiaceae bacterium]|nr:aminotransferase class I/II-fold pyridoxal phosphate-dependent enzyme [Polyangiaceae bacterium]
MHLPPDSKLDTLAVHGRSASDPLARKKAHDAVPTPIVCSATYTFGSTAELRDHFEGRADREEYGRYGNPTVRSAERAIAALEGAEDAALFASGMAAITTLLFAVLKAGDHVVLTRDVYRRTRQFVTATLSKFGVESTLVDPGDLAALESSIIPGRTRLVFTELPTNPYLRVVDLDAVSAIVRRTRGVKLVVDATFATPVNLRALERGAHLVVHSCTKYLAGHNDVLAGAIAGDENLVSLVRDVRGVLGSVLDPHAAFLVERGMKTLALRVRTQNESGARVAAFLSSHPAVQSVFHPSLASHPDHEVAKRLLRGFGGVVSFRVRGDLETTSRFIDHCRLATIAPSLGGTETLIEQVALMSYYGLSTEDRLALGIPEDLVRLSVGIEDVEDIIADLDRALRAAVVCAEVA